MGPKKQGPHLIENPFTKSLAQSKTFKRAPTFHKTRSFQKKRMRSTLRNVAQSSEKSFDKSMKTHGINTSISFTSAKQTKPVSVTIHHRPQTNDLQVYHLTRLPSWGIKSSRVSVSEFRTRSRGLSGAVGRYHTGRFAISSGQ